MSMALIYREIIMTFTHQRLIYITDWFATFLHVAGLKKSIPDDVDSVSAWKIFARQKRSSRKEIVFNIDREKDENLWSAAIRSGNFKLIWGQSVLLKQKVRKPFDHKSKLFLNLFH